jgi:hypothetical protein
VEPVTFFRVLRREAWPVVVPMYRLRECPDCGALVLGKTGQRRHEMSGLHAETIVPAAAGPAFPEDGWEPVYPEDDE